jgi:hypothetical protein
MARLSSPLQLFGGRTAQGRPVTTLPSVPSVPSRRESAPATLPRMRDLPPLDSTHDQQILPGVNVGPVERGRLGDAQASERAEHGRAGEVGQATPSRDRTVLVADLAMNRVVTRGGLDADARIVGAMVPYDRTSDRTSRRWDEVDSSRAGARGARETPTTPRSPRASRCLRCPRIAGRACDSRQCWAARRSVAWSQSTCWLLRSSIAFSARLDIGSPSVVDRLAQFRANAVTVGTYEIAFRDLGLQRILWPTRDQGRD